jgi:hypothetical protein
VGANAKVPLAHRFEDGHLLDAARAHNCAHVTTTAITAPTECPKATTATITNKSSQTSLQLTHELGGYIRWMCSRTPTENLKNTSNTKIHQLSLSATP